MEMLLRAGKILMARHRIALAGMASVVVAITLWLVTSGTGGPPSPQRAETDTTLDGADIGPDTAIQPRAILGRVWFDKYPDKARDVTHLWIFLGGGVALYERGSAFRFGVEFFDFERQGDRMVITALQDKKTTTAPFKIERCDHEPFDLCLTFETAVRGPKTLYGFSERGDEEARVPSSSGFRRAAEARAPSIPRD